MRLSEKTIEINFCAQVGRRSPRELVWFGLTQAQEARAGFDVCTRLGGRLLLLQFKASAEIVRGARRFRAPHDQMLALKARCRDLERAVFYVLPALGTTEEFARDRNLLRQSWLLDVADIPKLEPPTRNDGRPRRSRLHYLDLEPPIVTIHSEPVRVSVLSAGHLMDLSQGRNGLSSDDVGGLSGFLDLRRALPRNSVGAIVFPQ